MTDEKRIEEIRGRLAALPSGFVLGVEGSYYDDRHLVANMWGEAEEGGDAGPLDPNQPSLLDFRDHAMSDFAFLLAAYDAERARAVRAEGERDAWPAPAALPNLDDHPLQDSAAANRELRKLLYTVDADRKRSDVKVRELAAEVWRLREAMPAMDEVGAARGVLRYVGHSGAHGDICDYADVLSGWLDRIEKARGG